MLVNFGLFSLVFGLLLVNFGLFSLVFGPLLVNFGLFSLVFGPLLVNFGSLLTNSGLDSTESETHSRVFASKIVVFDFRFRVSGIE